MNLRFGETTRGRGLIFLRVAATGTASLAHVSAHSVARDGREVPANVLPVPELNAWVVVLAILSVSQRVTITAYDEGGAVLCSAKKTVAALAARVHSSANTLLHNPVTELIRNYDERMRPQGLRLRAHECVSDAALGVDLVYGDVSVSSCSREEVEAQISLELIGPDATSAALEDWSCMGDVVGCRDGVWHRVVSYSFRIPHDLPSFCIWARSSHDALMDGVLPYESQYLEGQRSYWRDYMLPADENPEYDHWFLSRHRVSEGELELQRQEACEDGPLFSIVVPLFRTPLEFFRAMVDSVLAQSYERFELVLVNASPGDQALGEELGRYVAQDERVRVTTLEENLGIAKNTLRGIACAQGDFVLFCDHDDTMEPDALYRYARVVRDDPNVDLIYCDEDKLRDGHYLCPFFKPDWNVDLLRSVNYVCHLLAVRKTIVDELPAEYAECDGAQDHFLTLFAGERARSVVHVPKVLYHWRMHEQSTSGGDEAKPYTTSAGIRAIQAHCDRCGIAATVSGREGRPNTYALAYELMGQPKVSILIPNKDLSYMLRRCVESVLSKTTYPNYEVVIIENNSQEPETFACYGELAEDKRVRVVTQPSDGTFNFSKTINFGVERAEGDYLLFLNNDTEVITGDWIERMLGICMREDTGAVGVKLLYPNDAIQHAGVTMQPDGPIHLGKKQDRNCGDYFGLLQLTQDLTAVTAACMMTSRAAFELVGGFDEDFPIDCNDVVYCLRLRDEGLLVVYEPEVELYHYESISRGENKTASLRLQWVRALGAMMVRWTHYFALGDPYWNPNLDVNAYHRLNLWPEVIYND